MIFLRSVIDLVREVTDAALAYLAGRAAEVPCPRMPACPPWCPCRVDADLDDTEPESIAEQAANAL